MVAWLLNPPMDFGEDHSGAHGSAVLPHEALKTLNPSLPAT